MMECKVCNLKFKDILKHLRKNQDCASDSWPTELSAEGHVTIQCVFQTYTTWKLIGIRHREEINF